MKRILLTLAAVAALTLGFVACDTYPSGCIRIEPSEVPWPYYWTGPPTRAVYTTSGGGSTFIGVSGGSPWWDATPTWRAPNGPNHYERSYNCWLSSGGSQG